MAGLDGGYLQFVVPIDYVMEVFGIQWYIWVQKLGRRTERIVCVWMAGTTRDIDEVLQGECIVRKEHSDI